MVAEDEDFALGGEEGELVFSGGGEGADLDVGDDGADVGGQVFALRGGREEVRKGGVGIDAMFSVLEWFEGWVFSVRVPNGEVVGVLVSVSKVFEVDEAGGGTLALGRVSSPSSSSFLLYDSSPPACSLYSP